MIYGLLTIAAGVFCIYCAYKDYDWFMGSSKAWLFVKMFGRDGARKFYIGLGAFIIMCGLTMLFVR